MISTWKVEVIPLNYTRLAYLLTGTWYCVPAPAIPALTATLAEAVARPAAQVILVQVGFFRVLR